MKGNRAVRVHFMHLNWAVTLCGRDIFSTFAAPATTQFPDRVTCANCQKLLAKQRRERAS